MSLPSRATIAVAAASALLASLPPREARAEPTPAQKTSATVLFREARALMEHGEIAAACRRFEESQRLDPLPGTLLNMAVCHEKEGRTATAWVEFSEAQALARRDGRDDRMALAAERLKALEPRLLRIRIVFAQGADVPGLTIALDGAELPRPAWDSPLPVDPGEHVVEAAAVTKVERAQRVTVMNEGETKLVTVERLEDAPAVPPTPAAPPPASAPATRPEPPVAAPYAAAPGASPPGIRADGLGTRRQAALVLGGAAVFGLAAGTYFGIDAIAKHADSNAECPASNQCSPQGVTDNDASKTSADRSTVAFGASLALLGAAAYLWFSGGAAPQPPATTALRIAPVAGRTGGGALVVGAF
jgi:hypothetical protein